MNDCDGIWSRNVWNPVNTLEIQWLWHLDRWNWNLGWIKYIRNTSLYSWNNQKLEEICISTVLSSSTHMKCGVISTPYLVYRENLQVLYRICFQLIQLLYFWFYNSTPFCLFTLFLHTTRLGLMLCTRNTHGFDMYLLSCRYCYYFIFTSCTPEGSFPPLLLWNSSLQ